MGTWRCRECGVTVSAPSARVLERMGWVALPIPVEQSTTVLPVLCPICMRARPRAASEADACNHGGRPPGQKAIGRPTLGRRPSTSRKPSAPDDPEEPPPRAA
jgi:hypothetical protein